MWHHMHFTRMMESAYPESFNLPRNPPRLHNFICYAFLYCKCLKNRSLKANNAKHINSFNIHTYTLHNALN